MNQVLLEQAPPAERATPLAAFQGCGIELEYALVSRETLDVVPIADRALQDLAGVSAPVNDVERGSLGWSNELTLHVIELKNADPRVGLETLAGCFQAEVRAMNAALAAHGAQLMPAGMHPWMDPCHETRLWPHANAEVYRAYDRIFDCRTHGYANLQSMHVNLPFSGDAEFGRLHAAVRAVLPILPALAASSPYREGRDSGALDERMRVYRVNAARVPEVTGQVVPEPCEHIVQYHAEILQPLYRAIAPLDPAGVLRYEWLNARGAIARFERDAIEIRVLDSQECPRMDVGLAALTVDLLEAWFEGRVGSAAAAALPTASLAAILRECVSRADRARITDPTYLRAFGVARASCRADELWAEIGALLAGLGTPRRALWQTPLEHIQRYGTLARRLLEQAGSAPTRRKLREVYGRLCECLQAGAAFR